MQVELSYKEKAAGKNREEEERRLAIQVAEISARAGFTVHMKGAELSAGQLSGDPARGEDHSAWGTRETRDNPVRGTLGMRGNSEARDRRMRPGVLHMRLCLAVAGALSRPKSFPAAGTGRKATLSVL